ncbi:MAG TPA: ECF transporter S component [Clostridiales bacterium]|nr:ECF transporter S component [Clostridiales bacterium]
MKNTTKWLTRTAILLGLTVAFQSLRMVIPKVTVPGMGDLDQYIIGSLVNACLIIAAIKIGAGSGIIISILAPVIALIQGEIQFPILVPFVALGNAAIVICVALLYEKSKIGSFAIGIVAKFLCLYLTVVHIALPLILPSLEGDKAELISKMVSFKFSWPQIVTAAIGSLIASAILPLLDKSISK